MAINAGYSCIPCNNNKEPMLIHWRQYISKLPSIRTAKNWNGNIAVICGKVSGGLVCIDFDVKNGDRFERWALDINWIKPELLGKLYIENTPSGGYHVCYRFLETKIRNKKLACPKEMVIDPETKRIKINPKTNKSYGAMIETRGEGGYFVCAPSNGYSIHFGKLLNLQQITKEEESILIEAAKSYNELNKFEYKPKNKIEVVGDSVFNRYDSVTDPIPLLVSHGWAIVYQTDDKVLLTRPGKDRGVSASWNYIPNRLYVFSSSTIFEQEMLYKSSAIYTMLEHNGNYHNAAKELAQKGFGDKKNNAK